jgi:hypothetical protein
MRAHPSTQVFQQTHRSTVTDAPIETMPIALPVKRPSFVRVHIGSVRTTLNATRALMATVLQVILKRSAESNLALNAVTETRHFVMKTCAPTPCARRAGRP